MTGNRTSLTVTPGGGTSTTTNFTFDALNRLASVTDSTLKATTYGYDNVGNRLTVSYPNGNITDYFYDSLNRLTQLMTVDASNTVLVDYQYTLDASGHRTQIAESSGRVTDYRYDDLYRLTDETITDTVNGNYSANYQYDAVGNRTYSTINGVQTAYVYDDNDRLIQQGGETYTYDANGNTLSKSIDGETSTYNYDARNHLSGASLLAAGITTNTRYEYDVDGIRIAKTENANTIDYLVDSNRDYAQVLKETDQSTSTSLDYLYGDDLINQSQDSANEKYYLYDGLGSTRALSDSTGVTTDTYDYEAFGSTLNQTGSTPNNYLFTGEQYDQTLDQQYLRARYYDPHSARFTQQDTWMGDSSAPSTLNKYLYAGADPINKIDPTGKSWSLTGFSAAFAISGTLVTISTASIQSYSSADTHENPNDYSSFDRGLALMAVMGAAGEKLIDLFASKELEENDEKVNVYHGSFDASSVRANGLRLGDGTMFVSRDIGAATDALGSHRVGIESARDPGIVTSEIPKYQFDTLLLPNERPYNGFYPYLIQSTEIPLRTTVQIELFNFYIQ